MNFDRRAFLAGTTALAVLRPWPIAASASDASFGREDVIAIARDLASKPYQKPPTVPEDWLNLEYDQYRRLRFRQKQALWSDTETPYVVDFFAPGLYFRSAVTISTLDGGAPEPVAFDASVFETDELVPDLSTEGHLGYSGFRLRTELTEPGKKREFCVFQGASYFRAIGYGMAYGLSARGIAVDTGEAEGEEFPDFTHFWLERPEPGQRNMIVHALLDGPGVTGAYRFDISPGANCVMEVEATLFPRRDLDHVGLGPLTSMFLFDATNRVRFDDFRPAVHDSQGLLMWNGSGEVLWRPLANPKSLQISLFVDENPQGFGLMQRRRKFADYNDLEALYHKRPGAWVEPMGDWGEGYVELVEIPSDKEVYDNIVAFWRPRTPLAAGSQHDFSYRLTWCAEAPVETGVARVVHTATGASHAWSEHENGRLVTVEFEPHELLEGKLDDLEPRVNSSQAEVTTGVLQRNPETGGVRLAFAFDPGDSGFVELRAQILREGSAASEVWLYRWTA